MTFHQNKPFDCQLEHIIVQIIVLYVQLLTFWSKQLIIKVEINEVIPLLVEVTYFLSPAAYNPASCSGVKGGQGKGSSSQG